jgi:TrmH family RNA methyltransferase
LNLDQIKIVMVETTHPGNIGAAARAMKNMGLNRLALVAPQCPIGQVAYSRASGANDVLDGLQRHDDLPSAVADCNIVIGSSARSRTISWPTLTPRELGELVAESDDATRIAVVFGREHSGLTNEELQHCHYCVTIPTNPDFSSLNVASSIQVIAYEIYQHLLDPETQTPERRSRSDSPASSADVEGLYQHLEEVLYHIEFIERDNPRQMLKRLRRLFQRAVPTNNEVNILRGILSAVQKKTRTGSD